MIRTKLINKLKKIITYKEKIIILLIFISAILIRIHYINQTPYQINTHDVGGHIEYIEYISKYYKLPQKQACWECWHPPLYYIISAITYKMFLLIYNNKDIALKSLQCQSLLFMLGVLFFSLKIAKQYIVSKKYLILFLALISFWPSLIIHSGRIGNDLLLYFFVIVSLHLTLLWNKFSKNQYLYLASLFAGLALITKLSGLVSFVFIGVIFIMKNKKHIFVLKNIKALFIIFLIFLLFYIPNYIRPDNKKFTTLIENIHELENVHELKFKNEPINYLVFDFRNFIKHPIANGLDTNEQSKLFWNFLIKTSISIEWFNPGDKINHTIISIINFLALLIYMITLLYIFISKKICINKIKSLLIFICLFLFSIIIMRIFNPYSCVGDFRYILFTLIPLFIIFVYLNQKANIAKYIFLKYIPLTTAFLLIILSLTLFIRY
ncbi:MAG: hypothetical protein GF332_01595 [Candidatus Moranbacteria bacterium]|nr:hypothetical protein [Candidatus Moranbacteria bacterium]